MHNIASHVILKVIAISGILITSPIALANNDDPFQIATPSLKETRKSSEIVEFIDGQFYVLKPASWSILDNLNDEADLQMGNLSQEAYCIVMSESKIDYDNSFTLEKYSELTSGFILEALANPTLSEAENMILNGQPAVKYELIGSINGIRVRYWHVSINTESHFHQVILWSLPSKFERNRADYEAVLNSFDNRF